MSLLSLKNIGKAFRKYRSEWQRLGRWFGLPIKLSEELWILRHVSFDIQPGEAIGIMGRNGAGKSTLLKIIVGIMHHTEGQVLINGRISAILELGLGFNLELTGRQNARHVAGLMGFTEDQINLAMPDIENFAEIGEYFDAPLRTYSSGMQMRVAFAVATAWRPDILIVDEALSVGDAYFQHKSFARIRDFRDQGTTLLIVSHDRSIIQNLCSRAVLLEKGVVLKDSDPEEVIDFYNALIAENDNSTIEVKKLDDGRTQTISGTGEARVEDIKLYNNKDEVVENVCVGEEVELRIKVKLHQSVETLVLGYSIKDRLGQVIYGTNTWYSEQVIHGPQQGDEYLFTIAFPANFGTGTYSVQTALVDRNTHLTANYEWQDMALLFNVININKKHFAGVLWNEPCITINCVTK